MVGPAERTCAGVPEAKVALAAMGILPGAPVRQATVAWAVSAVVVAMVRRSHAQLVA